MHTAHAPKEFRANVTKTIAKQPKGGKKPLLTLGIIEPEGIWKGSNKKDLKTNTIAKTGKKEIEYSTKTGCLPSAIRLERK